jgi:hypothetical protein
MYLPPPSHFLSVPAPESQSLINFSCTLPLSLRKLFVSTTTGFKSSSSTQVTNTLQAYQLVSSYQCPTEVIMAITHRDFEIADIDWDTVFRISSLVEHFINEDGSPPQWLVVIRNNKPRANPTSGD